MSSLDLELRSAAGGGVAAEADQAEASAESGTTPNVSCHWAPGPAEPVPTPSSGSAKQAQNKHIVYVSYKRVPAFKMPSHVGCKLDCLFFSGREPQRSFKEEVNPKLIEPMPIEQLLQLDGVVLDDKVEKLRQMGYRLVDDLVTVSDGGRASMSDDVVDELRTALSAPDFKRLEGVLHRLQPDQEQLNTWMDHIYGGHAQKQHFLAAAPEGSPLPPAETSRRRVSAEAVSPVQDPEQSSTSLPPEGSQTEIGRKRGALQKQKDEHGCATCFSPGDVGKQLAHAKIMISYTQRNPHAALLAEALHNSLEKRLGEGAVWLDVKMGKLNMAEMKRAAQTADCVIAIVTGEHARDKPEEGEQPEDNAYFKRDYCVQELRWAREANVPIQPVIRPEDKPHLSKLLALAPEDLRDLEESADFVHLDRSRASYWQVAVDEVLSVAKLSHASSASCSEDNNPKAAKQAKTLGSTS
jgi:hypothetical protein